MVVYGSPNADFFLISEAHEYSLEGGRPSGSSYYDQVPENKCDAINQKYVESFSSMT